MKILNVLLVFVIAAAMLSTAYAIQGDPVPGVDVSIEQIPGGIVIASTRTNNSGEFFLRSIRTGKIQLVLRRIEAIPLRGAHLKLRKNHNYNTGRSNSAGIVITLRGDDKIGSYTFPYSKVKNGMVVLEYDLKSAASFTGIIVEGAEEK